MSVMRVIVFHPYAKFQARRRSCMTGPTPGFQSLGELRDRPGKPKDKYNSKSALLFNGFNAHFRLTQR